ncbi:MAG: DUF1062 domain-containing protein [Oscillospiraceae bacterium]|nr:DUF1062 domain-containing protein [Oscillospiraceae bacterium]
MSYTNQREYRVIHKCGRCGKKMAFLSTRRFRVNANKNKLDVWLIYQCEKCKHTLNIPIYERTPPQKIPKDRYEGFLVNDEDLAIRYGMDAALFRSRHYTIEKSRLG